MAKTWTYRGCSISRIFPSGMYETYAAGRFHKADTLEGIKASIREALA